MHTSFNKKFLASVVIGSLALIIFSALYLFSTTEANKAELAYAEHSFLGKQAGAVIPASCNSNPPVSHFSGPPPDCPDMCQLSSNPDVSSKTTYSPVSNSCVCINGKTNPPNCSLPEVEIAFRPSSNDSSQIDYFGLTFTTSATAASMGQRVKLTWAASGRGVTCTASGGWTGNKSWKGSEDVTFSRSACLGGWNAQYTLTCTNRSNVTKTESVYVRYTNPSYDLCECNPSHKICRM